MKEKKLYAKFKKCEFWFDKVAFVGHIMSNEGIFIDPTNIEAISKWSRPTNASEI